MLSRHRTCKIVGAFFALILVVSTLQAQEPEPTPTPTPVYTQYEQAVLDEQITLRRFVTILGGVFFGWNACLLIYKWV